MPDVDVDPETIRVFPMDEAYWFSHYFDRTDLFERLREYYDEDHRFEILQEEFETVLRDSVTHWERRGQRCFLMKDDLAVTEALERGAERLSNTEYVLGL